MAARVTARICAISCSPANRAVDEARPLAHRREVSVGMLVDRATEVAHKLAAIPAGAFALTKEAFYAPSSRARASKPASTPASSMPGCSRTTYDTIRAYLDRTIKKIVRNPRS
jgi:hypothetical protein